MLTENTIGIVICVIVLVPLLILCGVLLSGRGGWLVAGYNTSSAAEKARWNEKRLCRFTGGMLLGFLLFLGAATGAAALGYGWLCTTLIVTGLVLLLGCVVYVNKSPRFKNQ